MNAIPTLSFFEKLYLPGSVPCTLEEIIILIRTRRWEAVITAYRASLVAGDKEGAVNKKGNSPVSPLRVCSGVGTVPASWSGIAASWGLISIMCPTRKGWLPCSVSKPVHWPFSSVPVGRD